MNTVPTPQRYLVYLTWLFAGVMSLGAFIGVLNDTLALITLPWTIAGTILIVLFWFGANLYLSRYPWQTQGGQISKLNFGMALPLIGMGILLWLPVALRAWPEKLAFPAEREGETLIVIATFHHTEGVADVNIHSEIQRTIQEKIRQLGVERLRVEVEPTIISADDREGAEKLSAKYDASIVIWGTDAGVRVTVNYLNSSEANLQPSLITIEETKRTQLAAPDAFAKFIIQDLPSQLAFLAFYAIGQTYHLQGNNHQAASLVQIAIESIESTSDPNTLNYLDSYSLLAYLYLTIEEWEKSIEVHNYLLAANPLDAGAYVNRGLAYLRLGNHQQASQDFDQAIQVDPQSAAAYLNRGAVANELELSIADYTKAIEINPQFLEAYQNRGMAHSILNEQEKAIADYTKAIELGSLEPAVFLNRGEDYSQLGDKERAIADYTRAIEINPQFLEAYQNRGMVYTFLNEQEKAIADYTKVIELGSLEPAVFLNRGVAYSELGDKERAIADYTRAIELAPQSFEGYLNRGYTFYEIGKLEEAIADLNKCLELCPDSVDREHIEMTIREIEEELNP